MAVIVESEMEMERESTSELTWLIGFIYRNNLYYNLFFYGEMGKREEALGNGFLEGKVGRG